MFLLMAKQVGATLLAVINAGLLAWSLFVLGRKQPMPAAYYRLLLVSAIVGLFQVGAGLYFLLRGQFPLNRHLLYGTLVGVGVLLQLAVQLRSAAGLKYRTRPHVHAALALFVGLVAIRSWMSG